MGIHEPTAADIVGNARVYALTLIALIEKHKYIMEAVWLEI